jgi:hypothetical protein
VTHVRRWIELLGQHRKAVLLTFEIFWIVVFLLEAAGRGAGAQVVQFVYVNF